jgi:hypothetical protein
MKSTRNGNLIPFSTIKILSYPRFYFKIDPRGRWWLVTPKMTFQLLMKGDTKINLNEKDQKETIWSSSNVLFLKPSSRFPISTSHKKNIDKISIKSSLLNCGLHHYRTREGKMEMA